MTSKPKLPSETTFMIDFNLEWVAAAAMAPDVPPAAAAAMFGITEDELAAYSAYVQDQVDRTAAELLAENDIADGIDRLPVPRGGTVMAVGDSITTYRYSYAELLQAMIAARRPDDNIQFVNEGQAGYTSTHGLESTYTQFLAKQPDLVFVMFGVNDCKRLGGPEAGMLVSIDAYRDNTAAIVRAFVEHTLALPVLLTPTPVVESLVGTNADFSAMRLTWDNADIEACADVVRDVADQLGLPIVDLMSAFGPSPDPSLYLEDGVHPGPTGHRLIAQRVIRELTPNHA